jgi:SAM-dependent methyltransferase
MDASTWNERYRSADRVWTGQPNEAVVEFAPPPPADGSLALALDLGCGEGADALWLAGLGYRVTGVDWAGVALERAEQAADDTGADARFVEGDITDSEALAALSATGTFALVMLAYIHPEPQDRERLYSHLPALVAAGGYLLVITHDPEHGLLGFPGPDPHRLMSADDILDALELPTGFEVVTRTTRPKQQDGDGEVVAIDSVVVAHRLA